MPESPNAVACFGGPVGAFKGMMEAIGGHAAFNQMTQLTLLMGKYKPRIDFFPQVSDSCLNIQDLDLPGLEEMKKME